MQSAMSNPVPQSWARSVPQSRARSPQYWAARDAALDRVVDRAIVHGVGEWFVERQLQGVGEQAETEDEYEEEEEEEEEEERPVEHSSLESRALNALFAASEGTMISKPPKPPAQMWGEAGLAASRVTAAFTAQNVQDVFETSDSMKSKEDLLNHRVHALPPPSSFNSRHVDIELAVRNRILQAALKNGVNEADQCRLTERLAKHLPLISDESALLAYAARTANDTNACF